MRHAKNTRTGLALRVLLLAGSLLAAAGCGGGGGGGGGGGTGGQTSGGGTGQTGAAGFTSFSFRTGPTSAPVEFTTPPMEDLSASPPKLGAPIDLVVVFHFDSSKAPPAGPFSQTTLPVYTTAADMPAASIPPTGGPLIPAKGEYVKVDDFTIEFRPFLPQEPLSLDPSADPDSIPGFIPGAVYTAKVQTTPGLKITNLAGAGGAVQFGITSLPGGYFSNFNDHLPPALVSSVPADGETDFYPGLFSNMPVGSDLPTFEPQGPSTFDLVFDHGVNPTTENLLGRDWNGDGIVDATFFLRCRATKLIVAHTVPEGAFTPGEPPFAALSGLTENAAAPSFVVDQNGGDIFLHNSTGPFPGGDPALASTPTALAAGADPSLTFALFAAPGPDRLGVIDHTLGDPDFARIAATSVAVPLDDAVGLITLLDGRLVAFDRTTRKLVELQPVVTRSLPLDAPTLVSVGTGFVSAAFPALDVRDLAQAPSGAFYALIADGGGGSSLLPLQIIDFDTDGSIGADDGLPDGSAAIPLPAAGPYDGVEFLSETTALALQREDDAVDLLDLSSNGAERVVSNLAGFGELGFGEPSPALAILVAHMDLDLSVDLVENQPDAAEFILDPVSVLAPETGYELMWRPNLASLGGVSAANVDPDAPLYVMGSRRLITVQTPAPAHATDDCGDPDPEGRVHDVLHEEFEDQALEDTSLASLNPLADWGGAVPGAQTSGHLTAAGGSSSTTELGDFRPQPNADFSPDDAYSSSSGAVSNANWRVIFLDTDAQHFPLADGSTPGVISDVTVFGGTFNFHDVIIPEGVWIVARGTNPLRITATGNVEIAGLIDVSGADGLDDVTFDTGFLPVPGGLAGAGGGRGGDAQPTLWNPKYQGLIPIGATAWKAAQYVTPERAEDGLGPVIGAAGEVFLGHVGGQGGLSTAGFNPNPQGFTIINNSGNNTEYNRPPGGGGGSYYFRGMQAPRGSGAYRVQSSSTWPPYSLCTKQDWINDAVYGNEEIRMTPLNFNIPNLQCVYLQGTPASPERFQPGGLPGVELFPDGDPSNDYIGPGGELPVLLGGQGGGGGGTRLDSFNASIWSLDRFATPENPPPSQPYPPFHYPALFFNNIFWSPSLFDAKGGGGGGGGGSVLVRAFGDIRLTRMGHIDASGGSGLGGETIGGSNYSGGGGGGSGGAIVLQAGGDVLIEADANHVTPGFVDTSLAQGAALDVSGGFGFDAVEDPGDIPGGTTPPPEKTVTRSDGGQGGFGLIQLQSGAESGAPKIDQGAFLFARQKVEVKLGGWNGGTKDNQREHVSWPQNGTGGPDPVLRYIDMLEYRDFKYEDPTQGPTDGPQFTWAVLNGSDPPVITPDPVVPARPMQLDSKMVDHFGRRLVREPKPQQLIAFYFGYDPLTFKEANWCQACTPKKYLNNPPGVLYAPTDAIPLSIFIKGPDGTPLKEDPDAVDPFAEFAHASTIDRLPVVPVGKAAPTLGSVSRGTSKWLDFNGVALRFRDSAGLAPPLFPGFNGTYNDVLGVPPPGKEALVVVGAPVSNPPGSTPAHFVDNTGSIPTFDPGLCPEADPPSTSPPFNDIKVDSPDYALDNVITDNASVRVEFQGAYAIRAGSHVPDPDTLTGWVSDLRDLSGYPLVRFRVTFDLDVNPNFPFAPDSKKPGVDSLRVRAAY